MRETIVFEPEAAVELFDKQPDKCWLSLADVAKFIARYGLNTEDMRRGLMDGILLASGRPVPTGYEDVCIRADSLVRWLVSLGKP